jgi:DNA mismatch repair protein MutL
MTEIALAHPEVYFTLKHHDRTLIKAPGVSSVLERGLQLLGKDFRAQFMEMEEGREGVHLFGLVSVPGFTKPTGTDLNFFVNRRPVSDRTLRHSVYEAYETLLMRGRHPVVYLFLDLDPALVDVNVHPTKREVRFTDPRRIHDFTRDSVRKAVQGYGRTQEEERPPSPWPASERVERVKEAVESYLRTAGDNRIREERAGRPAFTGRIQQEPGRPVPAVRALFEEERLVPLGQIADSFIITQDRDGLILIDQHAAHERILYEKFKHVYQLSRIPVQQLLIPVNLDLSGKERILLAEHLETLRHLGIEVEDFGRGTFSVKGIPMWVADMDIQEIVRSLLEEIVALERGGELERRMEDIIHVFSCRAAVKANSRLSQEEMEALLRDLRDSDSPHTCEHGRPTMIRIDLYEIEKRFQRK